MADLAARLRYWWDSNFGWCRFLGHRYEPAEGCCLRCGGIPTDVWEGEGYGD